MKSECNKISSNGLEKLQLMLEDYRKLIKDVVLSGRHYWSDVYLNGFRICEFILTYVAEENGYKLDERGGITTEYGRFPNIIQVFNRPNPVADSILPKECQRFFFFLRRTRNEAVHNFPDDREYGDVSREFAKAMDYFTRWFLEEYIKGAELDAVLKSKLIDRFFSLEDILNSPEELIPNELNVDQEQLLHLVAQQTKLLENILLKTNAIDVRTQNLETSVTEIQKNIATLCDKIVDYQSLIEKQIQFAQSDSEVDRLMQAYADECTGKIVNSIKASHEEQSYELEKRKLIASIGQNAWSKLDDASKMFLISAKVMFNNLILLDDSLDYSGVCLLVTKALEVEMNNRFCRQYLEYLHECHREDYSEYPTPLIGPKGTPLPLDKFTMGSYAFILCRSKRREDTEMQMRINKKRLMEYTSKCIFKDMTIEDIENKLVFFANKIEDIRLRFRNPAAHTNMIRRCDAEECFSIVLDVEKLLKKMLDSFVA